MKPCLRFALAGLAAACSLPPETVWLRLELAPELAERGEAIEVKPRIAEAERRVSRGVVALRLKRDTAPVRLFLPEACPLSVDTSELSAAAPAILHLRPLFDAGPSERVVGLGRSFEVRATPNCPEAEPARATLAFAGGAPLDAVTITEGGRLLRGVTRAAPPAKSGVHGIVPVSAREQRRLRSELILRVQTSETSFERRLGIAAVARSSGLPNVGLTHPVLLSGDGWQLAHRPPGSTARLREVGGLFELLPDAAGVYRLKGGADRALSLQIGRYDHTPLDCGRSDCHAQIARSAQSTMMTRVLESDLGGCHTLENPGCASACHATGEPGTADGGFSHVASELGLPALPAEYEDVPRALRRLGGVGCLACHGPGAIPEPSGRWAILRSDVCAVCHDAPPRYGHVMALESSRMALADHSAASRAAPECARCHTTWGALGRPAPPGDVESFGLACVTCHDVHPHGPEADAAPAHGGRAPHGLLRRYPPPATLPEPPASYAGASRVCVSCHAPSSELTRPEASAAAILAGQGGREPSTGAALTLPAPHAASPKGCLACHDSGPEQLQLGKTHGFRATDASCARCHSASMPRDASLAKRARELLDRLEPARGSAALEAPWHARPRALPQDPRRARALRNVLLVLEDAAADVHHPAYARALLDAAERHLSE